jgi:NAD(P)-dependent dehydrogenase (short-subunit alcohol dehydrogenase family)
VSSDSRGRPQERKIDGRRLRSRGANTQLNLKVTDEEKQRILDDAWRLIQDPTSPVKNIGEFVVLAVEYYRSHHPGTGGKVSAFDPFVKNVHKALADLGAERFDYLVNMAGNNHHHMPFAQTTEEEFDGLCNVHFKGVYFLTQKLLPLINDGGRIVNISSGSTRVANPGSSAYGTMKGAIEVLTRVLANELGPRRIAVNTVALGPTATDFSGGVVRDNLNKRLTGMTALGRVGLPDDIDAMIASLLSEDNRWVNGQRIEVSGGLA